MNMQVLIPLDDMTAENGATSVRPRSHHRIQYPTDTEEYRLHEARLISQVKYSTRRVVFVKIHDHFF